MAAPTDRTVTLVAQGATTVSGKPVVHVKGSSSLRIALALQEADH
jgi:hypothetical protein